MSAQHTPTPWKAVRENAHPTGGALLGVFVDRADGSCIAETFSNCGQSDAECRANAAFIVRACNAHDALVAALSDLEDIFDGQEDCDDGVPNDAMRAMTIIRAALAKVGVA